MHCDGIIIKKVPELFATQKELKIYLGSVGKELQIQTISESAQESCFYVRLEDSANEFNE